MITYVYKKSTNITEHNLLINVKIINNVDPYDVSNILYKSKGFEIFHHLTFSAYHSKKPTHSVVR